MCMYVYKQSIIRVSLSKPHIDHDNGRCAQNNGMYPCIYLHVCIIYPMFVALWFPRSVCALKTVYSGILMCSCVLFTISLN